MSEFTLAVAGVRIRIRGKTDRIKRRYAKYQSRGKPDRTFDWCVGPTAGPWPDPVIDKGVLRRRDLRMEGIRVVTGPRISSVDSFLRIVLSDLLADRGGLLIHSAAVDGRLYPGRSGAGKSTLAGLAPRARVIGDELIAVRDGVMHSTPFWGGFRRGGRPVSRNLDAVYFLQRERKEGVRDVPAAEAAVRLLECTLCYRPEPRRARKLLAAVTRLVTSVPCRRLSYNAKKRSFRELTGWPDP